MTSRAARSRRIRGPVLVAAACVASGCAPNVPDSDWPTYLGDEARSHYSDLTHITPANVADLEVAWRYDTGDLQAGVSVMDTTALVVDGVLYGLSPTLDAFALNAATGEELWRREAGAAAAGRSQRGLMFWPGTRGDAGDGIAGRLFYTAGSQLIALDPRTGAGIAGFGAEGQLDLTALADGDVVTSDAPGVVFDDLIVLPLHAPADEGAAIAAIRATDGTLVWRFAALPSEGIALDLERELLFVPTGFSHNAFVESEHSHQDATANSLLALQARTGELRWQRRITGSDAWGAALTAPPTLVQIDRDGERVDAVVLPTRLGELHLLHAETGEPLDGAGAAGLTFTRQEFQPSTRSAATLSEALRGIDRAPGAGPSLAGTLMFPGIGGGAGWGGAAFDRARQRIVVNAQETASIARLIEIPAGFSDRDVYFVHCARCHGADSQGLFPSREDRYGAGGPSLIDIGERLTEQDIRTVIEQGRGSMPKFDQLTELERLALVRYLLSGPTDLAVNHRTTEASQMLATPVTLRDADGLPGNAPPWGTLTAIDLAAGRIDWQVPLGEYLSHPRLGLGAENIGGPVVTASGLAFIAATPDMKLRAFDTGDGAMLWEADLPAGGYATPAVYSAGGRQFVVIAAGGGRLGPPSGSEYVAFALPE